MNSIKLMLISLLSLYAVGCGSPFTAEEEMPTKLIAPDVAADAPEPDAGGLSSPDAVSIEADAATADGATLISSDAAAQNDGSYIIPPPAPPPPTGCADSAATIIVITSLGTVNLGAQPFICVAYYGNVDGWSAYNIQGRGANVTGVWDGGVSSMVTGGNAQLVDQSGLSPGSDGYIYWNWYPDTSDMIVATNSSMSLY